VAGLRKKANLVGYGVARPCRTGFKIGPLFADSADHALPLLDTLMAKIAGQQVQIDVPEANAAAVAMAGRFGLEMVFGCVRLYYGPTPDLPLQKIFAVTSLEFG
jgi:S-ribosylhomocysteine lyase LuxS involved in autoinducer biosynthesis